MQNITREMALSCVTALPNLQWGKYPAMKKMDVVEQVNTQLAKEGIRQVDDSIIEWKMHMLIRDILKKQSPGLSMTAFTRL